MYLTHLGILNVVLFSVAGTLGVLFLIAFLATAPLRKEGK